MPGRDDPFSWGDDDPTLDAGAGDSSDDWDEPAALPPAAPERTVTAVVTNPDGTTSTRQVVHPHADERKRPASQKPAKAASAGPEPLGNVALVGMGVLGGIYALFAVGWFIAGSRFAIPAALYLEPAGFLAVRILVVAAPVVWFVSVLVLLRRRPVWQRVLLLIVGVVVLVPWPFLTPGAVAA